MSEARLWPCELTAGALAAVKEALEAANAAVGSGANVEVTYRLYQRAEGGKPILLGRMPDEPRRCYVSAEGEDGGYFILSSEVEALITKLHGGTMKLRQTLSYEVAVQRRTRC